MMENKFLIELAWNFGFKEWEMKYELEWTVQRVTNIIDIMGFLPRPQKWFIYSYFFRRPSVEQFKGCGKDAALGHALFMKLQRS